MQLLMTGTLFFSLGEGEGGGEGRLFYQLHSVLAPLRYSSIRVKMKLCTYATPFLS